MNHSTIASLERLIKSYRETSRRRQNQHKKKIWESNRKKRAYKVNEHSVK
jgi:hypothetical protein